MVQGITIDTTIGKRENWIDYAKFVGIFLVILGHVNDSSQSPNLQAWIYSFHMPLFFILAGYFVNINKKTNEVFRSSVKALLIPYVCFYIIAFFAQTFLLFLKESGELTFEQNILQPFLGFLFGKGYPTPISNNINIPIWFLLALFICRVLFQFVTTRKGSIIINLLILNIASVLVVLLLRYYNIKLFLSADSALLAMPFYTFGYLFRKYDEKNKFSVVKTTLLALLLLLISVLASRHNVGGKIVVDICTIAYGKNILVFYVIALIGSLSVIYISKLFQNRQNKLFLYFGQNTIIILGVHFWIIHYMTRLLSRVNFALDRALTITLGDALAMSTLVLFLCLIPIYIIKNYFPFIIGKLK